MPEAKPPLFERLKQARIVQVLAVYLGASWAILQIADVLQGTAGLPDWVGAFTLLLLVIGLVVVMATAWVQSLTSTTEKEEAGELPTDWEIAPADAVASLKSGKLPHLTWGRAIMGGVVALSVLFGGAGLYVVVTGGSGFIGPAEAGADEAATGIAVLPFSVSGDEFELYREGMVELLSTNLDGMGGYRTIDSRTVLARWEEEVGEQTRPDLAAALRTAGRTGARYAVLGSLVPVGSEVRLAVEIYDVGDGSEVGTARAEGAAADIMAVVDALTVGVTRELLGDAGARVASEQNLASMTTSSVEALEYLLEGMDFIRRGDFVGAEAPLERAVALDSTFALGWAKLAEARGWIGNAEVGSNEARSIANRLSDRLAPREAILTRARHLYNIGDAQGEAMLRDYVRRYPDDAQAWYELGDFYVHRDFVASAPYDEVLGFFERAVELDPGFTLYYIHVVDLHLAAGNVGAARAAVEAYAREGGDVTSVYAEAWPVGLDLLAGDLEAARRVVEAEPPIQEVRLALGTGLGTTDHAARELLLLRAGGEEDYVGELLPLMRAGRWQESRDLLSAPPRSVPGETVPSFLEGWQATYGMGDPAAAHDAFQASTCEGWASCLDLEGSRLTHAVREGHADEASSARSALDRILADARSTADSAQIAAVEFGVQSSRAWAALEGGDPATALAIWLPRVGVSETDFLGIAMAAEAAGDLDTAEEYYLGRAWRVQGPFATYRLARLYDRTDRTEQALAQYRRLLTMWEGADADFPPLLEAAEAVARLGG